MLARQIGQDMARLVRRRASAGHRCFASWGHSMKVLIVTQAWS